MDVNDQRLIEQITFKTLKGISVGEENPIFNFLRMAK